MPKEDTGRQLAHGHHIVQADHDSTAIVVDGSGNVVYVDRPTRIPPMQKPPRAEHFTGREPELTKLLDDLQSSRVVTLCGPGGIGKTALAAEAVWSLSPGDEPPQQFPDGLLYYSFYGQPEAALALEHIARSFGEKPKPTAAAAAMRVLAGRTALVVLDGAESADDLSAVLDVRGNCGMLVTTRRRQDAVSGWQGIPPLSVDESLTLLQNWGGRWALNDNRDAGQQICALVGCLPLAVRLAGRYLEQQQEPAAEYLAWLEETPLAALDHGRRREESVPVLLDKSLDQVGARAREALMVVGLLAPVPLGQAAAAAALGMSKNKVRRPLTRLVDYGLLERAGGGYQVSHTLVHIYAQIRLVAADDVLVRLGEYFESYIIQQKTISLAAFLKLENVRQHISTLIRQAGARGLWDVVVRLSIAINPYLHTRGFLYERIRILEAGLMASRRVAHLPYEIVFLGELGDAYVDSGHLVQARTFYEQALVTARQIENRQGEIMALSSLGNVCRNLLHLEAAEKYYITAIASATEIDDRLLLAAPMGGHADVYREKGEFNKAITLHSSVLDFYRASGDRLNESIVLGNIGIDHLYAGSFRDAAAFFEQAFAISEEIGYRKGESAAWSNLGTLYLEQERYEDATEAHRRALAISEEIADIHGQAVDLGNLGASCRGLGQYDKALKFVRRSLALIEQQDVVASFNVTALGYRGDIFFASGKFRRAQNYYLQALDAARAGGDKHAESTLLGHLGRVSAAMRKHEQAKELYKQAIGLSHQIGARHNEGKWLLYLGRMYADLEDITGARGCYQQALEILKEIETPYYGRARQALETLTTTPG